MTTITVLVPDGDTCKGCDYKDHSSYEYAYQCYEEKDTCNIFKCEIKNNKKCIACKMLAKKDGDGNG